MTKRAVVQRNGKPSEVAVFEEVTLPAVGPKDARVEMLAAAINPADILRCYGTYGYGDSVPQPPFAGGIEGAGRVVEVGAEVSHLAAGDLVTLARGVGSWSEAQVAPAAGFNRLPQDLDPLQAAMMTVNPPTASCMLTDFVELSPGDWVIQNAGNSAVGLHVIRLAKRMGMKSINVVRRPDLIAPLKAAGADVVVVDGDDLLARVSAETGGALAALGIDAVGGDATGRIGSCLNAGGTVVNYGLLSGEDCRMPAALTVFNDIRLHGFLLPRSLQARSIDQVIALYGELAALVADGTLAVTIEARYPLDRLGEALDHAEREGRDGKIMVVANP